jgi:glycosyltransferase involved in cell wall biosynthesis
VALLLYCSIDVGGFPFAFADALNRGGVETYFVCTERGEGHDSSAFHLGNTNVPWNLSAEFNSPLLTHGARVRRLRKLVEQRRITGCLATGIGVRALRDAGIPYLYWSYGNDLDACRWPERGDAPGPKEAARFVGRVLRGIPRALRARRVFQKAEAVMISPFQWETFLRTIGPKKLFWFPHMVPTEPLAPLLERKASVGARLKREFDAGQIFFSSTRQYWSDRRLRLMDDKGNDVMIRAFASYRAREGGKSSKLLLIDKGPSVSASRELASKLGVGSDVVWLPPVPRAGLADYYAGADLCFGQFGTPVLSFATLEPMAFATPVISFIEPPVREVPTFPEPPELLMSRNPDEIAEFMLGICSDRARLASMGTSSWRWVSRWCTERNFVEAIVNAMSGGTGVASATAVSRHNRNQDLQEQESKP